MLVVETIAKIRLAYFSRKMTIKSICRDFRVSRKVVRKVIRSQATEFRYERDVQPQPKIGPWPAVAKADVRDLHDRRHPVHHDDLVAPVELIGLARLHTSTAPTSVFDGGLAPSIN